MPAKHTPGPWTANGQHVCADNFLSMEIAFCSNGIIMGKEESFEITRRIAEANARLIAAAPELLEACENVAKDFGKERLDGCEGITDLKQCDKSSCIDVDYCERREKLYSMLCNVIAKAKGKECQ